MSFSVSVRVSPCFVIFKSFWYHLRISSAEVTLISHMNVYFVFTEGRCCQAGACKTKERDRRRVWVRILKIVLENIATGRMLQFCPFMFELKSVLYFYWLNSVVLLSLCLFSINFVIWPYSRKDKP